MQILTYYITNISQPLRGDLGEENSTLESKYGTLNTGLQKGANRELSNRKIMAATYIILNFLVATLKE